jgi:hypothetical protein
MVELFLALAAGATALAAASDDDGPDPVSRALNPEGLIHRTRQEYAIPGFGDRLWSPELMDHRKYGEVIRDLSAAFRGVFPVFIRLGPVIDDNGWERSGYIAVDNPSEAVVRIIVTDPKRRFGTDFMSNLADPADRYDLTKLLWKKNTDRVYDTRRLTDEEYAANPLRLRRDKPMWHGERHMRLVYSDHPWARPGTFGNIEKFTDIFPRIAQLEDAAVSDARLRIADIHRLVDELSDQIQTKRR